jgi:hypothetical protein
MKAMDARIAFIVDGSGNSTRLALHGNMDFTARKVG